MMQELTAITHAVEALEIDSAQKDNLLRLMHALEKQVKTYDFRLERAGKDKITLMTLLNRTSEDLEEEQRKVEAANRAKSDFLAVMSHEIRTPLNAIIGMTGLLMDTELTPTQQEFSATIRVSGDALLSIISDILDFSKIEAERIELEMRPFALQECVESAISLFRDKSAEKGLEMVYILDPQVPEAIVGDETRLRQILLNLLSNAIKFTNSGEIVITVTRTNAVESPLHEIQFSVRDTGLGIPSEHMDRLFHSFRQVDSSTTRKYGGTGLGLAISKRLAELMGGTMWVESRGIRGKGSTFHFTIRVSKADKPEKFYQLTQVDVRNRRMLIVDDNATNLQILSLRTRAWGMDNQITRNPVEALDWIRQGIQYDVALIDQQMPEMDGLTLAREIRKLRDESILPLILVSSVKRETIENGLFSAQLLKPVRPSQLYDTLAQILSGRESLHIQHALNTGSVFDLEMGKRMPLRILLAEDHITNQKLALFTLEKLGYRADVASNGLEVLDALDRREYDVILMDMQMPEMDGLQATRIIRKRISGSQKPRIIAMTANVTRNDRKACFDAGMDDYLSKPIRGEELVAALNKSQPGNGTALLSTDIPHPKTVRRRSHAQLVKPESPIDRIALNNLLKLIGDDYSSFSDLISSFLDESPLLLSSLRHAIETGNEELLGRASHTLKSSSRDFGATRLSKLSEQLELISKTTDMEEASELVAQMEAEYKLADNELRKIRAGANV